MLVSELESHKPLPKGKQRLTDRFRKASVYHSTPHSPFRNLVIDNTFKSRYETTSHHSNMLKGDEALNQANT